MEKSTFADVMKNKSTDDLVRIVTIQKDDYQATAVDEAMKELKVRNVNPDTFEFAMNDEGEKVETKEYLVLGNIFLSVFAFILPYLFTWIGTNILALFIKKEFTIFIIFPLIIVGQVQIHKKLKIKSEKKAKLFRRWTFYSYVFMISFFVFNRIR